MTPFLILRLLLPILAVDLVLGRGGGGVWKNNTHSYALVSSSRMILSSSAVGAVVGEIVAVPFETVPLGFLECNGQAVSRDAYPDLFSAIGTRYGLGPIINTFKVPDLRGRFLRGWDHGAGRDPDASVRIDSGDGTSGDRVGTTQLDQFRSHMHTVPRDSRTPGSIDSQGAGSESGGTPSNDGLKSGGFDFKTLIGSDGGGKQTNPININVMFVIRATLPTNGISEVAQICDSNQENCFTPSQVTNTISSGLSLTSRMVSAETALTSEANSRASADSGLQSQITTVAQDNAKVQQQLVAINPRVTSLEAGLLAETNSRISSNSDLLMKITQSEAKLEEKLSAERSDRTTAFSEVVNTVRTLQRDVDLSQAGNILAMKQTQSDQSAELSVHKTWLISLTVLVSLLIIVLLCIVIERIRCTTSYATSMPIKPNKNAFFSYNCGENNRNQALVQRIYRETTTRGLAIWFDKNEISSDITNTIVEGVRGSQCMVLFITQEYAAKVAGFDPKGSPFCKLEFELGFRRFYADGKLIPVILEKEMLDPDKWVNQNLRDALFNSRWIDFTNPNRFNENCNELISRIYEAMDSAAIKTYAFEINM